MVILYVYIIGLISESDTVYKLDSVYRNYYLFTADSSFPIRDSVYVPIGEADNRQTTSELKISGVKDFAFDIDQGFDQGLKLYVNGEIEGVKIKGALSDQGADTPTRRISEIEKMRLELWTKNFYGGLGDLSLVLPFNINDEIEGVRLGLIDKSSSVNVSYALSRGQYQRIEFDGDEGKQGPYLIAGPVIYGSERIFIADLTKKSRALNIGEDYSIDYEQGIINFTNRNIITNNTHIVIEYQRAIQDYFNIYQEMDAQFLTSGFRLNSIFHRTYDDKDSPLHFQLTSSEIESLRVCGDSSNVIHTYADTSASGNYIFTNGHFVYVGEGLGNYVVTFFYVGENNGSYVYDPTIKGFVYRGENQGNYTPEKLVPLPHDNQFYAVGLKHDIGVSANMYASSVDKNRFSPFDDSDNLARGYELNFDNNIGKLSVHGKYINYESAFHQPRGREDIDYSSEWNTADRLEELAQIATGIAFSENFSSEIGYGILNREHKRRHLMLKPLCFYLGYENIDTLNKYLVGFRKKIGRTSLYSQYLNQDMNHFTEYMLAYEFKQNLSVSLSGNYERTVSGRAILTRFDYVTRPISLSAGHRLFGDTTLIFGNGRLNIGYRGGSISGEVEQSQKYAQKRDEVFIKVKEGTGNYTYDPVTRTYIQKANGDYIRQVILLPDFQRVISRRYSLEPSFSRGILDLRARLFYLDEENLMNRRDEIDLKLEKDDKHFEINYWDVLSKDARYALEHVVQYQYSYSLSPGYKKFYGHYAKDYQNEKLGEFLKEERSDYRVSVDLEIIEVPQVKPYAGYKFSKITTEFFPELNIVLHTPSIGLLLGKPIKHEGRIELNGELVYRKYNMNEIPYFFSANEPPGLTKILTFSSALGISNSTVLSLIYRVQLPPSEKPIHNLRFQTRIKF